MPDIQQKSKSEENWDLTYLAFMLRCWREDVRDGHPWRFTLVYMDDDEKKKGFTSLEKVCAYIRTVLDRIE